GYNRGRTVRILGPHFSGSQVSLEQTLRAWAERVEIVHPATWAWASPRFTVADCTLALWVAGSTITAAERKACEGFPPLRFRIISGSATSIQKPQLEAACQPLAPVKFSATLLPELEVIKATLDYLGVAPSPPPGKPLEFKRRLAVLCESNTTFGQSMRQFPQPKKAGGGKEPASRPNPGPTWFPFPLHVSDVRSAYEKTSGMTKGNSLSLPSFGTNLRLPLGSDSRATDTEPSLDSTMTAVTSERTLGTALNT